MSKKSVFKRLVSLICTFTLLFTLVSNNIYAQDSSNKCLKVVTGVNQWEGVTITAANLGLVAGHSYDFSMDVFTPNVPVGVVAQTAKYTWVMSANANAFNQENKQWHSMSGKIALPEDTKLEDFNISIVKMGDGGNYDSVIATLFIDNFKVVDSLSGEIKFFEDFEGASNKFSKGSSTISVVADPYVEAVIPEPIDGNNILRVVTGVNQWEGASVSAVAIGLELGKAYNFSMKLYTPDVECGILVQHSQTWEHIIETNFNTPEVKEWREVSGVFDATLLEKLHDIQITKSGSFSNSDVSVKFYIDDFSITNSETGEVVYFEDFENGSTKIGGSSANTSIVSEASISDAPIVEPFTGEYALDVKPLKDIYEDYFLIGNIINPSDFGTGANAKQRYDIFKHHYNAMTFENSMKPDAMWGNGTSYDVPTTPPSFNVDPYIETMAQDGIKLIGHTLAWHGQSPNWLNMASGNREDTTARYKTYAEANANLEKFISTVAGHYNKEGTPEVYSWDVLNEAVRRNGRQEMTEENWGVHTQGHIYASPQWNSPWYLSYSNQAPAGVNPWDYVYDAFLYARLADPVAILYYNDYGMDDPNQSTMVVNMVNAVNKRYAAEHPEAAGRLLIEGIGMQEHDTTDTSLENVENAIKKYITTGCVISITELDVGVKGYTRGERLSLEDEIKQGLYYAKLFQILKKYSDSIERVTFWGLDDEHSWRPNDRCLIFDANYNTKLSYYAIADPDAFIRKYDSGHELPTDLLTSTAAYGTPAIGGTTEDALWATTEALLMERFLDGATGATGTTKVLWDEENLYVQAKVMDSILNKANANAYEQDSVEIYLDETNCKSSSYINGMGQYRINYENYVTFNLGGTTSKDGFESFASIIPGGYMVELKIPFQFHKPSLGDKIGFDSQINDANASGSRKCVTMWSDTSGVSYANGSNWGIVELIAGVVADVNKTALAEAINNAKQIIVEDYNVGKEEFLVALSDAIEVSKNSDATQLEVDSALAALVRAISNLSVYINIPTSKVNNKNGQADINFAIKSANGKGYTVYLSESDEQGSYNIYNDVNYNANGVHIKGLTNGKTYWAYVLYSEGEVDIAKSRPVQLNPTK